MLLSGSSNLHSSRPDSDCSHSAGKDALREVEMLKVSGSLRLGRAQASLVYPLTSSHKVNLGFRMDNRFHCLMKQTVKSHCEGTGGRKSGELRPFFSIPPPQYQMPRSLFPGFNRLMVVLRSQSCGCLVGAWLLSLSPEGIQWCSKRAWGCGHLGPHWMLLTIVDNSKNSLEFMSGVATRAEIFGIGTSSKLCPVLC